MHTRSSSNLVGETSTNPKRHNRRRSKQTVKPFSLEENPVVTMADQRTMKQLLQAPTESYGDAIVIPAILAENYELKHGLLNLVTSKPFYGFEKDDPWKGYQEKDKNEDKAGQNRARNRKEREKSSPTVHSDFIGPARNPLNGPGQPKLTIAQLKPKTKL
ncbi:hypothetical protein Tco_1580991 [Tanacetum coccineum]